MYELRGKYEQLRDYQLECVTSVFDTFNSGASSSLCVLPMSAGKTVIVGAIFKRFLDKNPTKRAVMLSHLDILTKQNSESLDDFWGLNTGILQAQSIPTVNKNCIVSTMQSFSNESKVRWWGGLDSIGLCCIDEAHLYGSKSYDDIVAMLPPDCILLGVTATPFRDNKDMSSLFETTSYTISMQELIDRKQLVPPILHHMQVDDYDDKKAIHMQILSVYLSKHKGEKSIVFVKTIKECNELEQLFRIAKVNAKAITSKLIGKQRDECIKGFKSNSEGSADVLITVNVLTAGFSSNNVRSIFLPYKIGSVSAYLQRIGRGMRLDDGKDHVDIYAGGEHPTLSQERYDRMQRAMLTAGSREREEEFEEPELPEGTQDNDSIRYDADTVATMNQLKTAGFEALATQIVSDEFPQELLGILVETKKCQHKIRSGETPYTSEANFLERNGVQADGMNRLDATYAISALLELKGIPREALYVQGGKLDGKPYSLVTGMQKKYIAPQHRNSFYDGDRANKALYSNLDMM